MTEHNNIAKNANTPGTHQACSQVLSFGEKIHFRAARFYIICSKQIFLCTTKFEGNCSRILPRVYGPESRQSALTIDRLIVTAVRKRLPINFALEARYNLCGILCPRDWRVLACVQVARSSPQKFLDRRRGLQFIARFTEALVLTGASQLRPAQHQVTRSGNVTTTVFVQASRSKIICLCSVECN